MKTVNESDGWSYIILKNETPVIYQKYKPGIEGNFSFDSKADAKQVGRMVLKKLKDNKSPHITEIELKEALE